MSNAKKPETTGQTDLYKQTGIIAKYAGRDTNKKVGHKNFGKKFFKYDLYGPKAEIEAFLNHPDNQEYGVKYARDGVTPQYWCNWKDPFGTIKTEYPVYVNYYGNYSLDKEESKDIEDTMERLEQMGLHTAAQVYAQNILGKRLGFGLDASTVNRLAAKVSDGTDANLGE
jgi:hypothetical protein